MDFGRQNKPQTYNTCVSKGQKKKKKEEEDEKKIYVEEHNPERIVGEVRAVKGWNPIGRKVFYFILLLFYLLNSVFIGFRYTGDFL